jgi:hypothetical protein
VWFYCQGSTIENVRVKLAIAAIALVVGVYLAADVMYERKPVVRSFPAHWSITGQVPWGTAARHENGDIPVVLWHPVRGGYCYDAVFSEDLRDRLATLRASTVAVDYSLFSDLWARPRRHTVKTVSGVPVDRFGLDSGMIEAPGENETANVATSCEDLLAK